MPRNYANCVYIYIEYYSINCFLCEWAADILSSLVISSGGGFVDLKTGVWGEEKGVGGGERGMGGEREGRGKEEGRERGGWGGRRWRERGKR